MGITNFQSRTERPFRFVLPKKGRLADAFKDIAEKSALDFKPCGPRRDDGMLTDGQLNFAPVNALLLDADDALDTLDAGAADLAIVGRNSFEEKRSRAMLENRAFNVRVAAVFSSVSACSLWIAAPENAPVTRPADLAGLRIATSYPTTLELWLKKNAVKGVTIVPRKGSVEGCVALGLADAICDIVESGATQKAYGLSKSLKLFDSSAVLIERTGRWTDEKKTLSQTIRARLTDAATDKQTPAEYADQNFMRPAYA